MNNFYLLVCAVALLLSAGCSVTRENEGANEVSTNAVTDVALRS